MATFNPKDDPNCFLNRPQQEPTKAFSCYGGNSGGFDYAATMAEIASKPNTVTMRVGMR